MVGAGVGCYCTKTLNCMSQDSASVKYIIYSHMRYLLTSLVGAGVGGSVGLAVGSAVVGAFVG